MCVLFDVMVIVITPISPHQIPSVPENKFVGAFPCKRCQGQIRQVTWVDDTVAEIMHAAKDEAAPAAELSEAPDSKMAEKEEAEVPTEAVNEADVRVAEEDDGIRMVFL